MKTFSLTNKRGFTLIELMVVITILATLAAIAIPTMYSYMGLGDEAKCRSNLEQLGQLGTKYGQDVSHRSLLPTSGMDDDEDTKNIDESEGWWLTLAPELNDVVLPKDDKGKMKISTIFHCPADARTEIGDKAVFPADTKSVSYVSWTDASEDPANPNSCIRTSRKQNLDMLPWLSDGNPVKGESVTDVDSFRKQVLPAAERHGGKVLVLYASGQVSVLKVEEDANPAALFKKAAPSLAAKADKTKKGKKDKGGKKAADEDEDDNTPIEEEDEPDDSADDDGDDD